MATYFVTGCASGFGYALTAALLTRGHHVVATDPDTEVWPATLPRSDRLMVLRLDVRSDVEVAQAVAAALAWRPIDVLVNNAGYAVFATVEEAPLDAFRDLLDTNVVGAVRVTRALLPTLRARRGAVVQVSSVAGRTVFPESGLYAATKYALEAVSEALFQETCTFGVRVRVIEPGSFATGFQERAARASPAPSVDSPYAALRETWTSRKREVLELPQDPALVVSAILATLDDPAPFRRVPVGPDAERILALRDALHADVWSRLAADRNGLEAPHSVADLPAPAAALALALDDPRLEGLRAADRTGHLVHWADSADGREALQRLRGLSPA